MSRRSALKNRDNTPRRNREEFAFVQTDDDGSVASVDSVESLRSHKSRKSRSGHYEERVGIPELGADVFTYLNPSQSSKFLRTKKKIAEYASRTFGPEQYELIMEGTEPTVKPPDKPNQDPTTKQVDPIDMADYQQDRKFYNEEKKRLEKEKAQSFMLVLGQCVVPLRNALESKGDFTTIRKDRDVVELISRIETLVYETDKKQNQNYMLYKQLRKLCNVVQARGESEADYAMRFRAQAETVEKSGGVLVPSKFAAATDDEKAKAKEAFLACGFMIQADRSRHAHTLEYLKDEMLAGRDTYPVTVSEALEFLNKQSANMGVGKSPRDIVGRSIQLAQAGDSDSDASRGIHCYKCGKEGYTTKDCPKCASVKQKKKSTSGRQNSAFMS